MWSDRNFFYVNVINQRNILVYAAAKWACLVKPQHLKENHDHMWALYDFIQCKSAHM